MEILVVMFIMFVLSKLFGGVTQQMPQDQRKRGGRPFPDIPSEWNFPRPADVFMEEVKPNTPEAPSQKQRLIDSGPEIANNTAKTPGLDLNNQPAGEYQTNMAENLLEPENLITGIILAEILQPPKSRRGTQ